MRTCSIDGCGRRVKAHGWCQTHYRQWQRTGDPVPRWERGLYPRASPQERLIEKVDRSGECWLWTGALNEDGYPLLVVDGRNRLGHRLAYEWWVGPIPDSFDVDHLCRIRRCVRPDHLEAVTHAENVRRSGNGNTGKTHCVAGHELSGDNLYVAPATNKRQCRACGRRRQTEHRSRLRTRGPT